MTNSTQGNKTIPQMTPLTAITTGMLFHAWDPTQPVGSRDGGFPVSLLLNTSLAQNANIVFAGPSSGVPAAPSFRALVAADLPTVPVGNGGTGRTTLGANGVLIGEGTAGVNVTTAGTAGQALVSGGALVDPAFGVTKPVGGGTGLATLTARAVLIGEGTANVAFASPGAAGQMLLSAGAAADPAFGNNPVITGGTIDGAAIGGTTPAAAKVTTLNASGNDALGYGTSNAQSIPNNANTTVTTWTKIFDRINANFSASTGVFTAPADGIYQVSGQIVLAANTAAAGTVVEALVVANGAVVANGVLSRQAAASTVSAAQVSAICSLTAGQTIVLQAFQNSGGAIALSGIAANNYLFINRVA